MRVTLAALAAALCVFIVGPARADGVYTVAGVKVDVTGATAADARAAGFAQAQKLAFDRLVKRLALPDEVSRLGAPELTDPQLEQIVSSVQIETERPIGPRYIGQLSINFDPGGVRKALRDRGLSAVDTRSAPILVVPQYAGAADIAHQWTDAWANGGFTEELVPVAVPATSISGAPDWAEVASAAAAAGATTALYANARMVGSTMVADLVEVGAGGARRDRGAASVPVTASQGMGAALQALAEAVNARVQNDWKTRLATGGGQRARLTVSAFYANEGEWLRLKKGLEGAGKTVISGISIDAVSKEGAWVSFSYVGAKDQLAAELLRNGIALTDGPGGAVLKLAPGGT
jgi:hypothetical protein